MPAAVPWALNCWLFPDVCARGEVGISLVTKLLPGCTDLLIFPLAAPDQWGWHHCAAKQRWWRSKFLLLFAPMMYTPAVRCPFNVGILIKVRTERAESRVAKTSN